MKSRTPLWTLMALIALPLSQVQAEGPRKLAVIGQFLHKPLSEISGIDRSETYKDVWWVHNDSGDTPRLFAVDGQGKIIFPGYLKGRYHAETATPKKQAWPGLRVKLAANIDWEELVVSGDKIYIADVGNNGNARRDLGVYMIKEPNPRATDRMRIQAHYPVVYPDQKQYPAKLWHFDCEAVFASQGTLFFLTKHRVAGQIRRAQYGTKLYCMKTKHTDKDNVLTLLGQHKKLLCPTAADLSPNGQRLAVLCLNSVWIFEKPKKGDNWLAGKSQSIELRFEQILQAEGLCWDDDETLRVCNEQRSIFSLPLKAKKTKAAPKNTKAGAKKLH